MTKMIGSYHVYVTGSNSLPKNTQIADTRQNTPAQTAPGVTGSRAHKSMVEAVVWRSRLMSCCITKNTQPTAESVAQAFQPTGMPAVESHADRLTNLPPELQRIILSMMPMNARKNYRLLNKRAEPIAASQLQHENVNSPQHLADVLNAYGNANIQALSISGSAFADTDWNTLPVSLEYLNLSQCQNLTDQGLAAALQRVPDLQHLDVSGCIRLTDQGIATALNHVPDLRHLNLSRCEGLRTVSLPLRRLEELDVSNCRHLLAIQAPEDGFPALARFNLSSCGEIVAAELTPLLQRCRSLAELNFSFCRNLAEVILSGMTALETIEARHCENLTTLRLDSHRILKKMNLAYNDSLVTVGVGNLPALEELDLSTNVQLGQETNRQMLDGVLQNAGTNLKRLNLKGRIPSDGAMPDLRLFAALDELDISRASIVGSSLSERLPPSLKILKISDTGITDRHLSGVLRKQRNLEHLEVHRSRNVTSAGLRPLRRNFPLTLQYLGVDGCTKLSTEAKAKLRAVIPDVSSTS
ncbi:leucine-rich repeat domain-containing protein [Noviherbaspirillum aerium]|uniref:hypothetical protein n=1 Tax=Noviherbaspirillum aerium TaxID=2588497 RepID=UPI00178C25C6|nr:hypothetical protein [Noviherbaspirillum aerium]